MGFELTVPSEGVAVVFGGSGGVGAAVVERLAQAGANVVFTYFSAEKKANDLVKLVEGLGKKAKAVKLDLVDVAATRAMVDAAAKEFGYIHTAVYAAGPRLEFSTVRDSSPEMFLRYLHTDTQAAFNGLFAALQPMDERGGSLIACTTTARNTVIEHDGFSAMPKAGVDALIKQIAAEEGGKKIRANSVLLGHVDAGLGALAKTERSVIHGLFETGSMGSDVGKKMRLGRSGTEYDIANLVVYLASDQGSYITGQLIAVDGGVGL